MMLTPAIGVSELNQVVAREIDLLCQRKQSSGSWVQSHTLVKISPLLRVFVNKISDLFRICTIFFIFKFLANVNDAVPHEPTIIGKHCKIMKSSRCSVFLNALIGLLRKTFLLILGWVLSRLQFFESHEFAEFSNAPPHHTPPSPILQF